MNYNQQQPNQYQQCNPNPQYNQYRSVPPKPDNYLVWAILCTVLCCMPLGIVSIVKSTSVDSLYAQGRYQEAQDASQAARKWAMWGAIGGISAVLIYLFLYFFIFAAAIVANS